jgi:hypothetical protein
LRAAQDEVRRLLGSVGAGPAAVVTDALAHTLWLVVAVPREEGPATYTVRLPARRLLRGGDSVLRRPRARLTVDLLFPGADADRRFTLRLPDGVAREAGPPGAAPDAVRVEVARPPALTYLEQVMGGLLDGRPPPEPVARCLTDLAAARVDAARETLGHHRAPPGLAAALLRLRQALAAGEGVRAAWAGVRLPGTLVRDTAVGAAAPGVVEARTERIADPAHRGRPVAARAVADVAVTDSELLSSARFAGGMNLVLMVAVLAFLVRSDGRANVEVVAPALTLFAAIQAGRVAHPDATTFRGLLLAGGYWLVIPSILPTVILAVALAFVYADDDPASHAGASAWAALAIAGQLAFQVMLHRGPLSVRRSPSRPPAFTLITAPFADHARAEVLRGPWWRAAAAGAPRPGREVHAYLVRDRGGTAPGTGIAPGIAPVPDWLATAEVGGDVRALLRSGTPGQTLSYVVLRQPPPAAWRVRHDARPAGIAAHRLAAPGAAGGLVDVFAGVPRTAPAPLVAAHPATRVLRIAADHGLAATDVQLPVPPPVAGHAGLRWFRIRAGVPAAAVPACRAFLEALHAEAAGGGWPLVLRVVPGPDAPPPGAGGPVPVRAHELDVLDAGAAGSDPDAPLWYVAALCGQARAGLEADVLETLGAHHPALRLGGITSAVLHGTSVSLLLLRRDAGDDEPPDTAKLVAEFAADHLGAPLAEAQSAAQLGTPPGAGDGPLARVHLRAHDRPGLLADTVRAVRRALLAELGDGGDPARLLTWHARADAAGDGGTTLARLVLRLPAGCAAGRWRPERWERVEREVRRALAGDDAVVRAGLVRSPGECGGDRHMTS